MSRSLCALTLVAATTFGSTTTWAAAPAADHDFPPALDSYGDEDLSLVDTLVHRVREEPFNLVATLIFFAAIVHTFLAGRFAEISHRLCHEHAEKIRRGEAEPNSIHLFGQLCHFLGEVEVVFGMWGVALMATIALMQSTGTAIHYVGEQVDFTEAAFVVVIMTLAATRPILRMVENVMQFIAQRLGGSLTALWITVLTVGPILGSLITEPAAMTISAVLISRSVFSLKPSKRFKYATLGLLFVNVSIGGTLTSFSAPPVLMVAGPWEWTSTHMLTHFGWKAVLGILAANAVYYYLFRRELAALQPAHEVRALREHVEQNFVTRARMQAEFRRAVEAINRDKDVLATIEGSVRRFGKEIRERMERDVLPQLREEGLDDEVVDAAFEKRFEELRLFGMRRNFPGLLPADQRPEFVDPDWDERGDPVPHWVTLVHVLFMGWTIWNAHHPQLFIFSMLFFLGFAQITVPYQNRIRLQPAMLVGFFLAGLVIHGGVQGWWIAPVLGSLGELPLMIGATALTAFNDNAAITYLSTLVPGFTDALKYAVVAGAVSGGGLTVIANAPNPAGQSILKHHFESGISALELLKAAALPTIIAFLCFLLPS